MDRKLNKGGEGAGRIKGNDSRAQRDWKEFRWSSSKVNVGTFLVKYFHKCFQPPSDTVRAQTGSKDPRV